MTTRRPTEAPTPDANAEPSTLSVLDPGEEGDAVEILEIVGLDEDLNQIVDEPKAPPSSRSSRLSPPVEPVIPPAVLREEGRRLGWRQALVSLLPALDALEDAFRRNSDRESMESAVRLSLRGLWDVYRGQGLERIEGTGVPFDPRVHEAALVTATDRVPEGIVLEVLRVGYLLRDEMVRPALVRVSVAMDGSATKTQIGNQE